jgi:hypothetical protein
MRIAEFDEFLINGPSEHGGAKTKHGKNHTNGKSTSPHDARAVLSPLVYGNVFSYTPKSGVYAV